jgi:nicotinamidase-related amidase
MQSGSLAVPDGRDIIPKINILSTLPFILKIATRDHHPTDHISFITSHPGKKVFERVMTTHPDVPGKQLEQCLWPVLRLRTEV